MNKDQVKGKWRQVRGIAKKQVGKLTGSRREQTEGDADRLIGKVQETYGKVREGLARRLKP